MNNKYNIIYSIRKHLSNYIGQIISFRKNYSKFKIKYFYNKFYNTNNSGEKYYFYKPKKFYSLYKNLIKKNTYKIILNEIKIHYKPEHIFIRNFLRTHYEQ